MSKFKLTLDELKEEDYVTEENGLTIFYQDDVATKLHRLSITYENGRLGLRDLEQS
ncbi:hypothetical protein [Litchfieldia salsa]|uniref:hypothetical protein n=1 Tax=Litchfieldia salsa TaxID=930152 RepID=UPI001587E71E|nr:hypothetical protein [Litchfieldia salsa]